MLSYHYVENETIELAGKEKSFNRNWYFKLLVDSKKFLLIEHHSSHVSIINVLQYTTIFQEF